MTRAFGLQQVVRRLFRFVVAIFGWVGVLSDVINGTKTIHFRTKYEIVSEIKGTFAFDCPLLCVLIAVLTLFDNMPL